MKSKMLLLVGMFTFLIGLSPLVRADTAFTTPTMPSFSTSKESNSKADVKKAETNPSVKKSIEVLPKTDMITPPLAKDMNKYGSSDSPSAVMDEAKKKEARSNLDNYTSYMWVDDGKILTPSASIMLQTIFVRSQFFVTKTIYRFVNAVNSKLNGDSLITKWSTQVFASVQSIYAQFSSPDLYPLIAIGVISSLLFYWFKKRFLEGFRKIILVILLVGTFVYGGSDLTSKINTSLNDVLTSVVKTVQVAGVSATSISDLKTTMVEVPFLYLNFDDVIVNSDGTTNIKEDDIVKVLASDDDNDTLKTIQSDLKDKHLTNSKLGEKFLTALASMVNAVLVGVIYLAFSIISFVMRMLFLVLLLLLPFVAIMALFPLFDVVIIRWAKVASGTLILSNAVLLGTAIIGLLDGLLSSALSTMIGSDYFFLTCLKFTVYILMYKFRRKILDIFKAGHLTNNRFAGRVDGLLSNVRRKGSNIVKKPLMATTSAGLVAGLTAGQMATRKAKNIAKERLTAGTGSLWHGGFNKKVEKTMRKAEQVDPLSRKGERLLAKEERLKNKLATKKQRFNNPNILKTKVNSYRNQLTKKRKGEVKAQELIQKKQNKKENIQNLYNKNQAQLRAKAMERRLQENKLEGKQPSLDELAKNKHHQMVKENMKQREVKQSAQRLAGRIKNGGEKKGKPQFKVKSSPNNTFSKSNPFTEKVHKNPFEV